MIVPLVCVLNSLQNLPPVLNSHWLSWKRARFNNVASSYACSVFLHYVPCYLFFFSSNWIPYFGLTVWIGLYLRRLNIIVLGDIVMLYVRWIEGYPTTMAWRGSVLDRMWCFFPWWWRRKWYSPMKKSIPMPSPVRSDVGRGTSSYWWLEASFSKCLNSGYIRSSVMCCQEIGERITFDSRRWDSPGFALWKDIESGEPNQDKLWGFIIFRWHTGFSLMNSYYLSFQIWCSWLPHLHSSNPTVFVLQESGSYSSKVNENSQKSIKWARIISFYSFVVCMVAELEEK